MPRISSAAKLTLESTLHDESTLEVIIEEESHEVDPEIMSPQMSCVSENSDLRQVEQVQCNTTNLQAKSFDKMEFVEETVSSSSFSKFKGFNQCQEDDEEPEKDSILSLSALSSLMTESDGTKDSMNVDASVDHHHDKSDNTSPTASDNNDNGTLSVCVSFLVTQVIMSTNFLHLRKSSSSGALNAMVNDGFDQFLGPPDSGFSVFLAERTKKVHFIRHAEGFHNVATKETGSNDCLLRGDALAKDHPMYDARLTQKGIDQAVNLRHHLAHRPSGARSFTAFDLVVVSPLTRTCETALHVFGKPRKPGTPAFLAGIDAPEGTLERQAGIKVPAPRFLVKEECRERWGHYVCDGRRSIQEIAPDFPGFDFSEVRHNEDVFYSDERETDEQCCERAVKFLEWLNARPEKCIAVVTHSSFLRHLFGQFGDTLKYEDMETLQRLAGNCELRSIVLCSHGNKEGVKTKPLEPPTGPSSTVIMSTELPKTTSFSHLMMAEEENAVTF